MSIPRMRTITEALAEIKMADAGSAVTANCIRTLCKNGQVRCIYTGSKTLLDLDDLFAVINGTVRRESTAQEKNLI
jgi:hypothetical protein